MKQLIKVVAVAMAASLTIGGGAMAQTAARVYESGPVWGFSYVETKPGMFDDYMAYIGSTWRSIQEAQKRAGDVLDYRVLTVAAPRDHEADVILMVEYKNMGVFDRSLDEQDKVTASAFGSMVKSNQAQISREAMRETRGSQLARELVFKK
jgi:hypothetical protein